MPTWSDGLQARLPPEKMNRWCFNAMFAGALAAGMLAAPAIGSAAVGAVAAERPQAPASAAGHGLTVQPAAASAPGHAPAAPHASVGEAMVNIDACVARLDHLRGRLKTIGRGIADAD